jgi:ribosomal protein S18 acetylase RimI-like enzyme
VITPHLTGIAPLSIDRLSEDDLEETAKIHRLTFPTAAISQLGLAVAERYHASLLARDDVAAFVAFERSRVAGFCFGGTARDVEGAFLRENLGFIAGQMLARPLLLTQPFIRQRIVAGLRFLRPSRPAADPAAPASANAPENPAKRSFTILYLAVHPAFQRRGVARQLLEHAEQHAREAGFAQLDLSVYLDNARAIEFYEHAGWQRLIQDGEWQGFMFKPL